MERTRFVALDSCRGLAALAVVAFHFRNSVGLDGHAVFDSMFLFVDFFFVLSGFVIFAAYGEKLQSGYSVGRFLWLRFGRVYPLHIATLVALIILNVLVVYPTTRQWFLAPNESWDTIVANVLLVQSLNVFDFLTWNQPSWSISVEFFTYVAFAIATPLAGKKLWLACLIVVFLAPPFLLAFNDGKYLDATARYGIVRCLYGFCIGILTYELYLRAAHFRTSMQSQRFLASAMEIVTIVVTLAFMIRVGSGPFSLAVPLLFGAQVFVFAQQAGICSAGLLLRPFVFLGTISYSIYMVHMPILSWWLSALRGILFKFGGRNFFEQVTAIAESHLFSSRHNYPGLALMLCLVIAVASFTYVLVEQPFREWSRKSKLFATSSCKMVNGPQH